MWTWTPGVFTHGELRWAPGTKKVILYVYIYIYYLVLHVFVIYCCLLLLLLFIIIMMMIIIIIYNIYKYIISVHTYYKCTYILYIITCHPSSIDSNTSSWLKLPIG